MVIQRIWRSSQSIETASIHQTSSSEDSNSSWHTMSNSASSRDNRMNIIHNNNNNNGNIINNSSNNSVNNENNSSNSSNNHTTKSLKNSKLSNSETADNVLKSLKNRYNGRTSTQQTAADLAYQSIELMRVNVQDMFDKEIDAIVRKYVDTFFEPALKNVKENLGDAAVSEDYINKITVNLLDNAKQQYTQNTNGFPTMPTKTEPVTTNPVTIKPMTIKPMTINPVTINPVTINPVAINPVTINPVTINPVTINPVTINPVTIKPVTIKPVTINPVTIKPEIPNVFNPNLYNMKMEPCKRKISTSSSSEVSSSDQSPTHHIIKKLPTNFQIKTIARPKQIFWNISSLTSDTLFILDYKANRALGFIENHIDRLTNQHPELVRYLIDSTDKDWLIQHKILPPTHKHFRVMLLVLGEVCKIAQSDSYRLRHTLRLNELVGFKLPDFMMFKLKSFFNDLTQKSQNLLVGPSFIIANGPTAFSLVSNAMAASITNADQLISSTSSNANIARTAFSTSSTNIFPASMAFRNELPRIMQIKFTGRSALSSSHATLSALLSNGNTGNTGNAGQLMLDRVQ